MSSKTFPAPPGIPQGPSEEEQAILKEIDQMIQKTPQELSEKPVFRPKKSGLLVPLSINLLAGALVAGGILGAQWYFGTKEADLRQRPLVTYESAEGQVLEQIMAQSRSLLEAKNKEIQGIQDQLKNLGADQARWKTEAQEKIQAKRTELQKLTAQARETERQRLVKAGASSTALARALTQWDEKAQTQEKLQLEAFAKEVQAQLDQKNLEAQVLEKKLQAAKAEEQRIKTELESAAQKAKPLGAQQNLSLEEESQTGAQIQAQSQVLLRGFALAVEAGDLEKAQGALGDLEKLANVYLVSGSEGIRSRALSLKNAHGALAASLGSLKAKPAASGLAPEAPKVPAPPKEEKKSQEPPALPVPVEKPPVPQKEIPTWERSFSGAQTSAQKAEVLSKALKTEPVLKEMSGILENLRVQQEAADLEVALKRVSAQVLSLGPEGAWDSYLDLIAPPGSSQAKKALAQDMKTLYQKNLASLRTELTKSAADLGTQIKEKDAKIAALEEKLRGAAAAPAGDPSLKDQLRTLEIQREQEQNQLKALAQNYQRARDLALTRITLDPNSLVQAGKILDQVRDGDWAKSLIPSLEELFQSAAQAMTEARKTAPVQNSENPQAIKALEEELQTWKDKLSGLEKARQELQIRAETAEKALLETKGTLDSLSQDQKAAASSARDLTQEIQTQKAKIRELNETLNQKEKLLGTQDRELTTLKQRLTEALQTAATLESGQKALEEQKAQLVQEQKDALKKAAEARRGAFQDVVDFVAYLKGDSASATQSRTQIEAKAQQDEDYQKVLQAIQVLLKSGNRETLIRNEKTLVLGPLISFSGDLGQVDSLTGPGKLGQTVQIRRITSRDEQILAYGEIKKLGASVEIQSTRPVPGAGAPKAGDIVFLVVE